MGTKKNKEDKLIYRAPALRRKRMRVGNLGVYIATYTAISGSEKSPFLSAP